MTVLRRWGQVSAVVQRASTWLGIALAVDAVVAILGITIGRQFNLTGLLAAGPLLACARCTGRMTAVVYGYAVALAATVAVLTSTVGQTLELYRFAIVVVAGVFATFVAFIRDRRENALIHIAEVVQRAILRPLPAELGGVAFAFHYESATREAMVGGDLYDVAVTPFGTRLIVGDVKGKGLEAVGLCAAVVTRFRDLAFAEPDLVMIAEGMDTGLSEELGIEDFVTVILAEFDAGEVRVVNCGHHPPVKVGSASLEIMAQRAAPPLGLHPRPVRQNIPLKPGERLLFYTDGLVEARDHDGRFFEFDERAAKALAAPTLDDALRGVVDLLLEHTARALADDVLLLLSEPVDP